MSLKKRISALLICSSIVLGSITPAYADGANVVTLGQTYLQNKNKWF